MAVTAWSEKVVIPTYQVGVSEKNPMFFEKRVYQGSSGVVYPYPIIEKIYDNKTDQEWTACFLENDFLKIMILPELGGRVQMAYDKTRGRHFVYYNEIIKPALVGLSGPWISGGIEFNWPQHHRPTTYEPLDFQIHENRDGSKTIFCSEIERMFRTRGLVGFTLYPEKAYLEVNVRLYNRTSQPQTFLWWANPAVSVNDAYQSVFPPDVNAVFDHGKRDVSKFPVATGTYYKVDYSQGVDISRYKNIPVPTSYMAIRSEYDFVGGYDHESQGGLLHIANHHISPGKKQWTWGNGNFGDAWGRNLTESNGPYIELMCGVYTDNQPDFAWLMPYEEKHFSQYFMPYRDVGMVRNANKDIIISLEVHENTVCVRICTTGYFPNAHILVLADSAVILDDRFDFSPQSSYIKETVPVFGLPENAYRLLVNDSSDELLIEWSPREGALEPIPGAAVAAKDPADILSNEELYLNGLHLEQYRHATYDPTDYYKEAIRRNPGDIRSNNAMGMWLLRRGKFSEAETFFKKAVQTLALRNPNPYDGEPLYNLGVAQRLQGENDLAYNQFFKSVWNSAWMDPGYFQISQIDAARGHWDLAKENITRCLERNWNNHKARHMKVLVLRKLNQPCKALQFATESLTIDPFNFGLLYENYLLGNQEALTQLQELIRKNIHNYIEVALDYFWAGQFDESIALLDIGISEQDSVYPMAWYYRAWILGFSGKQDQATESLIQAERSSAAYCFPNQIESVPALTFAMGVNPLGAKAPYYLGNFWYNARQYQEALDCFHRSADIDGTFPTVFRNMSLLYYNKFQQQGKALAFMEKAFSLDPSDARVFMELLQLYKKTNKPADFRLALTEKYHELVDQRDDLYLEKIELLNLQGDYQKAYELIMSRKFHPWEGGEGKVSGAYVTSLVGMAHMAIKNREFSEAGRLLAMAKTFPENLGEGKLYGYQENRINYWLGCIYEGMNESEKASEAWQMGCTGLSEPSVAWFYNDQQPDTIYYQGLSLHKLGRNKEALSRFNKLIDYGEKHIFDNIRVDYFAVSLPDMQIWEEDLDRKNKIHCNYMMALGYQGKGMHAKAKLLFKAVTDMDASHLGAAENIRAHLY